MLSHAVANKLITGLGLCHAMERTQCLQYADDTIIFCGASKNQINMLKLILYSFELLTGLKINFSRSSLIGLGLTTDEMKNYSKLLGCSAVQLLINYLGISLHNTPLKAHSWNFLLEKLHKKLTG